MWLAFRELRAEAVGGRQQARLWLREVRAAVVDGLGARLERRRRAPRRTGLRRRPLAEMGQDLRYAVRFLRRNPGHTLIVALILGLGVGANVSVYELAAAVLLRPPAAVSEPDRLVSVWYDYQGNRLLLTHPGFRELAESAPVFSALAASSGVTVHVVTTARAEGGARLDGALVSGSYFTTLGVRPALGRLLTPADDGDPGAHPVVVVSHRLWRTRLGERPDVVGSELRINGRPFTVVGVASSGFRGLEAGAYADLWVPLAMQQEVLPGVGDRLSSPFAGWLSVVGRLAPGVSRAEAVRWLDDWLESAERQHPFAEAWQLERDVWVNPYARENLTRVALLLGTGVGLVLLVTCANLANLLMLQAVSRRRELAVRSALGAGRWRLFRQILVESVVLALLGGAVGLLVTRVGVGALSRLRLTSAIAVADLRLEPDARIAAVALLLAVGTALVFAGSPAWVLSRQRAAPGSGSATAFGSRGSARLRGALVVAQVALALVLCVGAALLVRSLAWLHGVDPGFEARRVVSLAVDLELDGYSDAEAGRFYRAALERLGALPGAAGVAAAARVPFGPAGRGFASSATMVSLEGGEIPSGVPEGQRGTDGRMLFASSHVAPGYFATLGIRPLAGRTFTADDLAGPPVAVVSESLATALWPDSSPLGQRLVLDVKTGATAEVVGVVSGVHEGSLDEAPTMCIYLPLASDTAGPLTFLVRAKGDVAALTTTAREALLGLDDRLTLYDVGPLAALIEDTLWQPRLLASLVGVFGALALTLAAVGLYGVIAYAVRTRVRELGLRMALGATAARVAMFVLRRGLGLALAGVVVGVPAAFVLTRLLRSELYGVAVGDVASFVAATVLLLGIAGAASCPPARRAVAVDPAEALRRE